MGLPGVKVGPLDPERTAEFGQVGRRNSARQLIRLHSQAFPRTLVRALARKLDTERSLGLKMDEVRDYLDGLNLPNGDPMVPEGAVVVGASVRGERDQSQELTFTFKVEKTGRTVKWHAPYSADVLPESYSAGSERVRVAELLRRGIVTTDDGSSGSGESALARENRRLKVELADARSGASDDSEIEEAPKDEAAGLRSRIAELEAQLEARDADAEESEQDDEIEDDESGDDAPTTASQDEPIDGFDSMKGAELAKLIKDPDTTDEERQAILDYEITHANRRGVVSACEVALGPRGSAD